MIAMSMGLSDSEALFMALVLDRGHITGCLYADMVFSKRRQ